MTRHSTILLGACQPPEKLYAWFGSPTEMPTHPYAETTSKMTLKTLYVTGSPMKWLVSIVVMTSTATTSHQMSCASCPWICCVIKLMRDSAGPPPPGLWVSWRGGGGGTPTPCHLVSVRRTARPSSAVGMEDDSRRASGSGGGRGDIGGRSPPPWAGRMSDWVARRRRSRPDASTSESDEESDDAASE